MNRFAKIASGLALGALALATSANAAAPTVSAADSLDFTSFQAVRNQIVLANTGGADLWNNGAFANQNGNSSEEGTMIPSSRTADDFSLCFGEVHKITQICGTVITNAATPNVRLEIYADCDGEPGALIASYDEGVFTQTGMIGAGAAAATVYDVCFDINSWFDGGRYWVSFVGIGDGSMHDRYWWGASTVGDALKGAKAKFQSSYFGIMDWTDVDQCCADCVNYVFRVCGESCKIIYNNADMVSDTGSPSEQDTSALSSRTVDNVGVSTKHDVDVCYVRAYIYTNCPTFTGKLDVYTDSCDVPGESAMVTFDATTVTNTGSTALFDGVSMTLYCLEFKVAGLNLTAGNNYWFSAYARGTGWFGTRSYWAYGSNLDASCPISISPARFRALWDEEWTTLSNEMALLVAGRGPATVPVVEENMPGDTNGDGVVNFVDLNAVLVHFGMSSN